MTKLQVYKKWDGSNLGTVTISNWRQGNGTPSIHETWINRFPFKQIQVPGTENLYLILICIFFKAFETALQNTAVAQ